MINQNTPEWTEMRKTMIGASDAPVIMEASPWTTPYQLWEQKLNIAPAKKQNPAMKRGHDLEDLARRELEHQTGLFFLPQVKFHGSIPWMMASIDAIDPEGRYIAEIKCPNKEDHQAALDGEVPEKYIPQLQHQLEVCELEMGYYFSFDGANGVLVKIYRDDRYIKKMLEKEQEFWNCMQEFTPPQLTERDYVLKTDEKWQQIASKWRLVNESLKKIEGEEKKLKEELIEMCNMKNSIGAGIRVSRTVRKGNIDYSMVPGLHYAELEKYRKSPIEYYKISSI